jgi:hypothetical protein
MQLEQRDRARGSKAERNHQDEHELSADYV